MIQKMQSLFKPVYLFFLNLIHSIYSIYPPIDAAQSPGKLGGFEACYSYHDVLATFDQPQYRFLPQVKEILEEYQYNCKLRDMNSLPKKYPLIVIEAPRRRKRFVVAKQLAKELGGAVMFSPPLGWSKFREAFNKTIELRRAFHALSIYGSANNAIQYLGRKPVVMSGFWMDQSTFAIAKKYFPDLPPKNSSVFQWPKDLIKPDYVFYINEPLPRSFTENKEDSIRYQILQVYRHWADPPVVELYMDEDVKVASTVEDILRYINSPELTTALPSVS